MSEMVERVARAICNATGEFDWDEEDHSLRSQFTKEARAAIAAMRKPTEAMLREGERSANMPAETWQAMIDAALKEPS